MEWKYLFSFGPHSSLILLFGVSKVGRRAARSLVVSEPNAAHCLCLYSERFLDSSGALPSQASLRSPYVLIDVPGLEGSVGRMTSKAVDTIGIQWPSTCPISRIAFSRRNTALDHNVRAALHRADYSTTGVEEHFLEPTLETGLLVHRVTSWLSGVRGSWIACGFNSYLPYSTILLVSSAVLPWDDGGREIWEEGM